MDEHKLFVGMIASRIASLPTDRVQRVAIDGVDGAGKTTLANELAPLVAALGRGVIRASVDGFHNPREVRYKRGKDAETFFSDSYNYDELKRVLLNPLSPGGNREYTPSIFNVDEDRTVVRELKLAGESDILIFDGIFLHRQELRHYWDFSVFLDVSFEQSIPRGAQRGAGSPDILDTSNARYINGQKNYLQQFLPQNIATVHVDYNDLKFPRIVRINQG